ncbi:MAG TPA: hypothetical protein VGJ48_14970 [Pyrinomonadaceae bacterium]|jgi:hypothetical protein
MDKEFYEMKIILWCLLLAALFHPGQSTNKSTQSFRIIPIQKKETGYSNFASIAFMSKNDLESFLKDTSTQIGWNNRQEFEDALRNAKLDFTKEALVLLRHTEGSGSVQVTLETPILQDRRLLCEIQGRPIPPGYGGTADMAYYCFAVAVSKSAVSQVELQAVEGGFSARRLAPMVLPINEKEPANKLLQQPVKQDQIQDCPRISVTCPDSGGGGSTPIRFKASVIGGKPRSEVSYNWSVSKGTISQGQGTAVIEVEVTGMDLEGLTAIVEISGFEPNCNRVASCSMAIP